MMEEINLGICKSFKSEETVAAGIAYTRSTVNFGATSPIFTYDGGIIEKLQLRANIPVGQHYEVILRPIVVSTEARKFKDE